MIAAPPISTSPARDFSLKHALASAFAGSVTNKTIGVFTGIISARLLGPIGRGELASIVSLELVIASFGEFELPRGTAYGYSRGRATSDWLVSSVILALAIGGIEALVGMLVASTYLPPDKSHLLHTTRWFLLTLPLTHTFFVLCGVDQGRGRFGRLSIYSTLPAFFYAFGIGIIWLWGRPTPNNFALATLGGTALALLSKLYSERSAFASGRPSLDALRQVISTALSFYLPAVASIALSRADLFVIVRQAPSQAVGLYMVAQAIAVGQMAGVAPFVSVGFTAVARHIDRNDAVRALEKQLLFAQTGGFLLALLSLALTPWCIRLAFGPRFIPAVHTTYLLILASMLAGINQVADQGLRVLHCSRAGLAANSAALCIVLVGGATACRTYGMIGLAASVALGQLLAAAIFAIYGSRQQVRMRSAIILVPSNIVFVAGTLRRAWLKWRGRHR